MLYKRCATTVMRLALSSGEQFTPQHSEISQLVISKLPHIVTGREDEDWCTVFQALLGLSTTACSSRDCHSLFNNWLSGRGKGPPVWKTLIDALRHSGIMVLECIANCLQARLHGAYVQCVDVHVLACGHYTCDQLVLCVAVCMWSCIVYVTRLLAYSIRILDWRGYRWLWEEKAFMKHQFVIIYTDCFLVLCCFNSLHPRVSTLLQTGGWQVLCMRPFLSSIHWRGRWCNVQCTGRVYGHWQCCTVMNVMCGTSCQLPESRNEYIHTIRV